MHEKLPGDEVCSTDTNEWHLTFDGSSTHQGGGARIVLSTPDGTTASLAYKLDFLCTNSDAKYEALVIGLTFALRKRIQRLQVQGDSKLIIKQINGDLAPKEIGLAPYRAAVQKLVKGFEDIQFQHIPQACNQHDEALAALASKINVPE